MSDPPGVEAREARLLDLLGRARRGGRVPLMERLLFIAGSALTIAGVVLILIGWVGTSQTVLVAGQIPYVVSGGLLGLALVFLGGFLYFGHWIALLVQEGRERGAEDRADLARLGDALVETNRALSALAGERGPRRTRAVSMSGPRVVTARAQPPDLTAGAQPSDLVATAGGRTAHRPSCRAVSGRPGLRPAPPGAARCRICGS